LWSGTAASFVDLTPPGSANTVFSEAIDVRGGIQVGFVQVADVDHAYMWTGSAASAIDLQSLLPGSMANSRALSIDAAGNIFGVASDTSGHVHAVEWSVVPEPSTFVLFAAGAGVLGSFARRSAVLGGRARLIPAASDRLLAFRIVRLPLEAIIRPRPDRA